MVPSGGENAGDEGDADDADGEGAGVDAECLGLEPEAKDPNPSAFDDDEAAPESPPPLGLRETSAAAMLGAERSGAREGWRAERRFPLCRIVKTATELLRTLPDRALRR